MPLLLSVTPPTLLTSTTAKAMRPSMPQAVSSALASTPEANHVRSSASTPSLRSRDGSVPMLSKMDGGGNVRVVVRVRAFLQRGP